MHRCIDNANTQYELIAGFILTDAQTGRDHRRSCVGATNAAVTRGILLGSRLGGEEGPKPFLKGGGSRIVTRTLELGESGMMGVRACDLPACCQFIPGATD